MSKFGTGRTEDQRILNRQSGASDQVMQTAGSKVRPSTEDLASLRSGLILNFIYF